MAIFLLNGTKIFIHQMYAQKNGELPPENQHAIRVQDVDRACAGNPSAGLLLRHSPYLHDPDGQLLEITNEK